MYIGRIVIVGRSNGHVWAGYRVSSRSYPNRRAEIRGQSVIVSPINLSDLAKNPYIAYNCIRTGKDFAVVANGTQADMIFEKIEDGARPLDAIALSLVAYGYERDELDTPRLAGAVREDIAWLGIAKKDEFRAKEFRLDDGDAIMVATYEKADFEPAQVTGKNAGEIAEYAFKLPFEKPVCSAAAFGSLERGFELAVYNPSPA
ncbi:MAG: IMP cyclohydrolase [Methanotrichaceae archaeon]